MELFFFYCKLPSASTEITTSMHTGTQSYGVRHLHSQPRCQMVVLQSARWTHSQGQQARLRAQMLTKRAALKQLRNVVLCSFDAIYCINMLLIP